MSSQTPGVMFCSSLRGVDALPQIDIDLSGVEQLVEMSQTRAVGDAIAMLSRTAMTRRLTVSVSGLAAAGGVSRVLSSEGGGSDVPAELCLGHRRPAAFVGPRGRLPLRAADAPKVCVFFFSLVFFVVECGIREPSWKFKASLTSKASRPGVLAALSD